MESSVDWNWVEFVREKIYITCFFVILMIQSMQVNFYFFNA